MFPLSRDLPNQTNTWLKTDSATSVHYGAYTLSIGAEPSTIATQPTTLRVIRSQSLLQPQPTNGVFILTFGKEDGRPHSMEDAPFYKLQTISAVPQAERNIWRDLNLPFSLIDGKFSVSEPINANTNRFYRVVGRL